MSILNAPQMNPQQAMEAALLVMEAGYTAYLHGAPGIGKSQLFENYAKERDWGFRPEFLAQKSSVDVRGLPSISDRTTKWTTPDFMYAAMMSDPTKPFILLLDELSAATPDIQVAAYQLLQTRQLGEDKLPDHVYLCGAGNRPEDGAIAYEMNSALADRLCHFNVVCDPLQWLEWAEDKNRIHPLVLAFIRNMPKALDSEFISSEYGTSGSVNADAENMIKPTPRSWERVSNMLFRHNSDMSARDVILNRVVPGWMGTLTTHSFLSFLKRMDDVSIKEYYMVAAQEPDRLKTMIPKSQDVLYGVLYNVVYAVQEAKHVPLALRILEGLCSDSSANYSQEIKITILTFLLKKIFTNSWMQEIRETPEYKALKPQLEKLHNLQNHSILLAGK